MLVALAWTLLGYAVLSVVPPTDKQVTLTAIEIYRLTEGKIDEQWVNMDTLSMMQQLGAVPVPGQ